jgi:hypothetical protein
MILNDKTQSAADCNNDFKKNVDILKRTRVDSFGSYKKIILPLLKHFIAVHIHLKG